MFICGFISFTVWSSFTGRIISLSRSHIPPLRTQPPSLPAPSLSHSRQAIKILSATLLKNYGTPLVPTRVGLLAIFSLAHDDRERTYRALSFYLHLATSFYLFWFMSLRSLSLSRCHIHHSTPLQDLLFTRLPVPLVACSCLVLSPFVHLVPWKFPLLR